MISYTTKILFTTVALLLLTNACQENQPIIKQEKMATILWDIQVASIYLKRQNLEHRWDSLKFVIEQKKALKNICSLHQITPSSFQSDIAYYESHPYQLQEIMQEVAAIGKEYSEKTD